MIEKNFKLLWSITEKGKWDPYEPGTSTHCLKSKRIYEEQNIYTSRMKPFKKWKNIWRWKHLYLNNEMLIFAASKWVHKDNLSKSFLHSKKFIIVVSCLFILLFDFLLFLCWCILRVIIFKISFLFDVECLVMSRHERWWPDALFLVQNLLVLALARHFRVCTISPEPLNQFLTNLLGYITGTCRRAG